MIVRCVEIEWLLWSHAIVREGSIAVTQTCKPSDGHVGMYTPSKCLELKNALGRTTANPGGGLFVARYDFSRKVRLSRPARQAFLFVLMSMA